ncbi:T9SS type A sorting domain-containing protein [Cecembia lonarensis]|uniref:PKD domain-containing protein n=1 Tax=Cecembia lonarensis (strain CCUG 58316 / KCTC 22772 / LW9) TaxID=1225176 RepID=K1LVU6_CECL9|nr:T9SS type A sorting domain-containing protein [Cecembia lonarensis]EKB48239.1 hypothetical protein B879_03158 [Cecembia lonarensis LW9]
MKKNYTYYRSFGSIEAVDTKKNSCFGLPINQYCKVLILVFCFISFFAVESFGTHFRYGNISWRQIDANTVEFQVAMAFRSNYTGFIGGVPGNLLTVGTTFTPDLFFFHGDGTSRRIQLTVTSRSISDNWSYAEGTFTKTYSNSNGIYLAYFESCCRISTLVNNRDARYQVETVVNLGQGNTSPVSTMPPIINLPVGNPNASFIVPASDPDGDVLSFFPTPSAQMGSNSSNPSRFSINETTGIATFNTNGTIIGQLYNVSVTINDNNGSRIAVDFLVRIVQASNPPIFVSPTPPNANVFTISVGEELSFVVKAEDPDPADFVTLQVVGLPSTATMTPSLPLSGGVGLPVESSFSWVPSNTGTFIVNYTAEDNNGAQATTSVTIVVIEKVCDISLGAESTPVTCVGGNNGTVTADASGGAEPYEYSIDGGITYQSSNVFDDLEEGTYTISIKDANGCTEETNVDVGQQNDIPVINFLTGPSEPISLSAATVQFEAGVTDDNLVMAVWNWGDGQTSIENDPNSIIIGTHTYQQAGVYPVTLTVTDLCGETDSELFEFVVVFDPTGGFVTGGGWIHSPAGAYVNNPSAEGRANFGFVSKYQRGATVPTGQTQFQFQAEKFNFHSTSYEWLVVAGHRAQFKGEGRVNGQSGYGFMLTAIDGDKMGDKREDRFRIKIWELTSETIIYDNQMGASDDSEASTELQGGSIVIHEAPRGNQNKRMESEEEEDVEDEVSELTEQRSIFGEISSNNLKIYPNPASTTAQIQVSLSGLSDVGISIFDSAGRLIYGEESQEENSFTRSIPLDGVSSGIYHVIVKINHQYIQGRLVKQ